jgi:hypothetical protein
MPKQVKARAPQDERKQGSANRLEIGLLKILLSSV